MQGYVLVFRPGSGRGTILSDGGETYSFLEPAAAQTLQGGDRVAFAVESAPSDPTESLRHAREVQVVRKWTQSVESAEIANLRQLLEQIRFNQPMQ